MMELETNWLAFVVWTALVFAASVYLGMFLMALAYTSRERRQHGE